MHLLFNPNKMRAYNKVFLIGNCASDPILDETKNKKPYLNLTLAVNRDYQKAETEGAREVDFHRIIMWGKSSTQLNELIKKGSRLFIDGKLINNSYEINGEKKYFTEIHADQIEVLTFLKENKQKEEKLLTS